MCKCGWSSSQPSPPDNTPEEVPTPQLARCTLPMQEDNEDKDSEINNDDSNKEN